MPNNKFDSKSFNAEAFKYMVARVPNLNMNEIKKSRALAANPDFQEVFSGQNGTAYARLAMRGLIDGDAVDACFSIQAGDVSADAGLGSQLCTGGEL